MRFLAVLLFFVGNTSLLSQEVSAKEHDAILKQIKNLRTAHLNSDVDLADKLYHPQLILTSQSGKKYKKDVALENIKNTFEIYESSEIEFINISDNVVLTNYINERKYKDFDKGKYRLTVVWTKHEDAWKIISMQSSKIKERKKN
ncbi:nuclear transport factor 2 family protein [uncultured Croceitalea sp.]|uniref:nuclear transport factor 2 family protein n=1 Tax=uncultured Croceitalea sp. TaxID=1798908 RepID=UPI00374FAA68